MKILALAAAAVLLGAAAPDPESQAPALHLDKVIDGDTLIASGQKIELWGITAPDESNRYALASTLYLTTMLGHGNFACRDTGRRTKEAAIMRCQIDQADVGSLMVQMGMARASDHYYDLEETTARDSARGMWKTADGQTL